MFTRPDWRNPEPYKEFLESSNTWFTAWEFLRRNPNYQRDLKVFRADWKNKEIDDDPDRFMYWCDFFADKWKINRPVATEADWVRGHGEFDGSDFVIDSYDRPELFKALGPGRYDFDGPHVLIPVDLSVPWEVLVSRVTAHARRLRDEGIKRGVVNPRKNRLLSLHIYVQYLRILDAFAAGVKVQEIGEVLEPNAINDPGERQRDKRIRAAHKAALKMVDGGYLSLVVNT